MECHNAKELIPYIDDGSLDIAEESAARRHVESCPACGSEYENITRLVQDIRDVWGTVSPVSPDGFLDGVRKGIDRKRRQRAMLFRTIPVAAAVIAAFAISVASYMFAFRDDQPEGVVSTEAGVGEYNEYLAELYIGTGEMESLYPVDVVLEQQLLLE